MLGIIVVSHGKLAEGLLDSAKLIVGSNIANIDMVCYEKNDSLTNFISKLDKAIDGLDTSEGLVILLDMMNDSIYNYCLPLLQNENFDIICGVNLPLLVDIIIKRYSGECLDLSSIASNAGNYIINVREHLAKYNQII